MAHIFVHNNESKTYKKQGIFLLSWDQNDQCEWYESHESRISNRITIILIRVT